MTNGEKYRDEILSLVENGYGFAILNGEIKSCKGVDCAECSFYSDKSLTCGVESIKWMYEEYQEPPTINQAEYDYLSFVNRLYGEDALVYRGASSGDIMILYAIDKNSLRDCFSANTYKNAFVRKYNRRMLPFIDDKTTMTVGELLKLKVVED